MQIHVPTSSRRRPYDDSCEGKPGHRASSTGWTDNSVSASHGRIVVDLMSPRLMQPPR